MWADFGRRKPPPPLKRRYLHFIRWNTEIRSLTQALFYLSAAFCGIVSRYDSRIGRNELVQLFAVQCINSGLHAEVANIVTGSFVIERIFSIPGLGRYYVESVNGRDYPMIMATTLFFSFIFIFCMVLMDILYAIVDPRVRKSIIEGNK